MKMTPNYDLVLSTNKNNAIDKNWKVVYVEPYLSDIPATTGNFNCNVGMEEAVSAEEATITLAPNPARDFVTVSIHEKYCNQTMVIMDAFGRTVYNQATTQSEQEVPIADLPSGLYLVKVGSITTKLIKR